VFHGFIRWTLVLLMALLPPCLVAVLELPLTLSATVLLLVATLVSAWSLDQVTDCWTRTALPEIRGPWGLPRVGIIRGRPLTLLPTLLPILVAVPLAVASTGGRRLLLACVCMALVVAIPRISWWWSVLGVLVVVLLGGALGIPITESLPAGSIMLGFVGSIRSTLWLTATVRDIEELRADQGRLAVAEERLRFARDLHDVTGRDLSAITVKAELVAQLAERADARAADQAREVATIARDSLASTRALVRGYREVDLAVELQGTASLLRSRSRSPVNRVSWIRPRATGPPGCCARPARTSSAMPMPPSPGSTCPPAVSGSATTASAWTRYAGPSRSGTV
jgi:two-component system sensor histidine kinase DesK